MAKIIAFKREAKEKLAIGINLLAKAVKTTLGPRGSHVLIKEGEGRTLSTKDGQTVARSVILKDRLQNLGAAIAKEAAEKTASVAGDGTTTAIVLTEAIFREGLKRIFSGHDPMQIKKGLDTGLKLILEALTKEAKPVSTREEILKVATLSSNHDKEIGKIITEAVERVGKEGSISIESGQERETKIKLLEGLSFQNGYLSPYFITNPEKMQAEFNDPYIFITDKKLSSAYDVVPLLELITQLEKKPLLIIAAEIEGEALSTLVINKLKGGMNLVAVKAPSFGNERRELLQDMAILTNASFFTDDEGFEMGKIVAENLGKARTIKVDKEKTTIIGGFAEKGKLKNRTHEIKHHIEKTKSEYEIEKLKKRISSLTGGACIIKVGGFTDSELHEKKDRMEDALSATRAAMEEGVVVGGGIALLRARDILETLSYEGATILKEALLLPFKTICENAGENGEIAFEKACQGKGNFGFNALTGIYEDLVLAGVIEPLLVVKTALTNAVSVAGMLLTVEAMVADKTTTKER